MKNRFSIMLHNQDGLTLVEVMMAFLILLLVFTGLIQGALLSIDHNSRNSLREEAITMAAMRMEDAKSLPFASVVSDTADAEADANYKIPACEKDPVKRTAPFPVKIDRALRNATVSYGLERTVTDIDANTKRIQITVMWPYRDECFTHSVSTLRRR